MDVTKGISLLLYISCSHMHKWEGEHVDMVSLERITEEKMRSTSMETLE